MDGQTLFPYLIPKLFDLVGIVPRADQIQMIQHICGLDTDIILDIMLAEDRRERFPLVEGMNPLIQSILMTDNAIERALYIDVEDRPSVIAELRQSIDTVLSIHPTMVYKQRLVTHLLQGHADMEYGLYFSMIEAENKIDFMSKFRRLHRMQDDMKMIYYTSLKRVCRFIMMLYQQSPREPSTEMIYMNRGWQYGKLDESSIQLEREPEAPFTPMMARFMSEFDFRFTGAEELICQYCLPEEIFSFFFVEDSSRLGKRSKNKLMNKKKHSHVKSKK
jgi:hypothetical protein